VLLDALPGLSVAIGGSAFAFPLPDAPAPLMGDGATIALGGGGSGSDAGMPAVPLDEESVALVGGERSCMRTSCCTRSSGERDGCVRKGIGDGREEGTGVCRPPAEGGGDERDGLFMSMSTRERFGSVGSIIPPGPGLNGRLSEGGECRLLVDEIEPRCDVMCGGGGGGPCCRMGVAPDCARARPLREVVGDRGVVVFC